MVRSRDVVNDSLEHRAGIVMDNERMLTPEETLALGSGESVIVPVEFLGNDFCYHLVHWRLTNERLTDLPSLPNIRDIESRIVKIPNLIEEFHAVMTDESKRLEELLTLGSGTWLIRLYDFNVELGHWITIEDGQVFDPAFKELFPLHSWVAAFANRMVVARIYRHTK